jgi:signal transduction histidine kinase
VALAQGPRYSKPAFTLGDFMHDNKIALGIAALMTAAAALISEWFANPQHRIWHATACLIFMLAFAQSHFGPRGRGWNLWLVLCAASAACAAWFGGFGISPALYVIVGSIAFERLPKPQFWLLMIALNSILLLRLTQTSGFGWALSGMGAYVGFQLFGLLMSSTSLKLENANLALLQSNAELNATRALLAEGVRSGERLRLSRELHDVCGHKLTALKLTLRQAVQRGALQGEDLQLTHSLTDQLLDDVRGVVSTLRHSDGVDLRAAMRALQQCWRTPAIELKLPDDLRTPDFESAQQLLRITQEAITNAARHGDAKTVAIEIREDEETYHLHIQDDGKGKPPFSAGNGLSGMRERVAALGGDLQITANLPQGVRLSARWPRKPSVLLEPIS